jgi:hypothetical protein
MPVTDELEKEQKTVLVDASSFILNSALAYENCLDLARATKARMAIVDDLLGPAVNAAHKAHKEAKAVWNRFMKPLQQAESIYKSKISAWDVEQRRIAEKERQRLVAEQRKRDEEERLRKAEELEAAAAAATTEDRKEELQQQADTVISEESPPSPIIVKPDIPDIKGVSTRVDWDFEIANVHRIPREYMIPDEKKIRKIVKGLGREAEMTVPGIKVIEKSIVSVRS